jgi:hypothetical protein
MLSARIFLRTKETPETYRDSVAARTQMAASRYGKDGATVHPGWRSALTTAAPVATKVTHITAGNQESGQRKERSS